MCYSGKCRYENYMGECDVCNKKVSEAEKMFGIKKCLVGGFNLTPEDEEAYNAIEDNKMRFYEKLFDNLSYRTNQNTKKIKPKAKKRYRK